MLRYEDQFTMITFIKSLTPDLQDQILKSQDPTSGVELVKTGPGEFEFLEKAKKGKSKFGEAVEHVSSTVPDEDEDRDDSKFGLDHKSTDDEDFDVVKAAIVVLEDYLEKGKPSQVPTQKEVNEGHSMTQDEMHAKMASGTRKRHAHESADSKKADELMDEGEKDSSKRHEATYWGVRDRIKKPNSTPNKRASEGEDLDLVKAAIFVIEEYLEKGKPSQVPTQKEVNEGHSMTQDEMHSKIAAGTRKRHAHESADNKKAEEIMDEGEKESSKRHESTYWGVRDRIKKPNATPNKRASEGEDFDLVKASVDILEDFLQGQEQ
jgi:hypothetical protein